MTTLEIKLETVPVDQLIPDADNARLHNDENMAAIVSSLKRFGQVKPIVVTSGDRVLAGNGTLAAAIRLGWKTVEVVRTPADWSDAQAMAYAIADNRTAELAEWNNDTLVSQLVDLEADGWKLNDLGFAAIPLREITETSAEKLDREAKEKNGPITCPKCGHSWLDSSLKVAAE